MVTIRPLHPADVDDIYAIQAHPTVGAMVGQPPTLEVGEVAKWVKAESTAVHRLVAEQDGRVLGFVTLTPTQRPRLGHSGTLQLMVHPDHWRQGIGTALLQAALDLADNWLNLLRLAIDLPVYNQPAVQLAQKVGFVSEGVQRQAFFAHGRYHDLQIMARLRHLDWYSQLPPPAEPARPPLHSSLPPAQIRVPHYPNDVPALTQLFQNPAVGRTTLQMPSHEEWVTVQRMQTPINRLYRYVADVDGTAVGIITLWLESTINKQHVGSIGMMVAPAYWGRGIGSQLMQAVVDLADEWLPIKRLELDVNTDNPAAVRLYQKYGFIIEGMHKLHAFGDGRMADSYFMGRLRA